MGNLIRRLAPAAAVALIPLAMTAGPPLGSAAPLNCPPGEWWDPTANVCRPLGVGPQPLNCTNGWWWDPTSNECAPPLLPPPNP